MQNDNRAIKVFPFAQKKNQIDEFSYLMVK